jgi:ATP-dependent DNA ligase
VAHAKQGPAHLSSEAALTFNLLELDGKDLRRRPLLNRSHLSLVLNEYYKEDGEIVFREACKLGCEGIVSKRLGSIYRRGRSPLWLKIKNPNAPAVKREVEEDWR